MVLTDRAIAMGLRQVDLAKLDELPPFASAVALVLRHEGGDADHPQDPGGRTRYGISASAYPNLDIANLTIEQAKGIYLSDYWLRARCDAMPYMLALPLFDAAVNAGVHRAATFLQAALHVRTDGRIGPKTLAAVDALDDDGRERVLVDMVARRCKHYALLSTVEAFGLGWFRRALETFSAAQAAQKGSVR